MSYLRFCGAVSSAVLAVCSLDEYILSETRSRTEVHRGLKEDAFRER